ncbi:hypothetical protein [Roseivivax halotolerans]|uniref:hypothetical protein n=1 Tax=Roseivivax halotolerans TaxID=93684 RepID=UPI000B870D63|nr:hypothetical protein [Roseivivax halotolerans]
MPTDPKTELALCDPREWLMRLARALRAGRMPARDAQVLAERLEGVAQGHLTAEQALGVQRAPGQRSISLQATIDARNEALRQVAKLYFPDETCAAAARFIASGLTDYQRRIWPRERAFDAVPERNLGRIEGDFWYILKLRDHAPSARHMRRIIAG